MKNNSQRPRKYLILVSYFIIIIIGSYPFYSCACRVVFGFEYDLYGYLDYYLAIRDIIMDNLHI